jgi:hypothetical protein
VTVEDAETTFRVHDGDQLLADVPRTTTKPIARFKARKPEPPRRAASGRTVSPARPRLSPTASGVSGQLEPLTAVNGDQSLMRYVVAKQSPEV